MIQRGLGLGMRCGMGEVRARGAVESSLVAGCVEIGVRGRGFVHSGVEKGFKMSKFEFAFERQPGRERVAEGGGFDLCGGG